MIYAIIDKTTNLVVNSIVLEDVKSFKVTSDFLLIESKAPIGASYINGEFVEPKTTVDLPTILQQIATLEANITPRRIRDAITTDIGKTWLIDTEKKLADLRSKL